MTLEELVEIAEFTASSEGWQLGEPIGVVRHRRFFGADEYRVLGSAPARPGAHAFVRICARSGDVLGSGWRAGAP